MKELIITPFEHYKSTVSNHNNNESTNANRTHTDTVQKVEKITTRVFGQSIVKALSGTTTGSINSYITNTGPNYNTNRHYLSLDLSYFHFTCFRYRY